ncbi:MAG: DsbA family protein [Campylobacterota bacterium]|nr:DsbA family protein [Campylobacterota bacterium]
MSLEKIIYVADPMCSWCWGFAPEIKKLRASLPKEITFSLIMGGLRNGHVWDNSFKNHLKENWEKVAALTGQPFSQTLLEQSAFNYTTEPACTAVALTREIDEPLAFDVLFALQNAFYAEGKDITQEDVIVELLSGFDLKGFERSFKDKKSRELARQDRDRARLYGAASFPALILLDDQGHLSVIRGYRTYETLTNMLVPANQT